MTALRTRDTRVLYGPCVPGGPPFMGAVSKTLACNVSRGKREGKPVHYPPLYMAGLVAAEASTPRTDIEALDGFILAPIDFSAFSSSVK